MIKLKFIQFIFHLANIIYMYIPTLMIKTTYNIMLYIIMAEECHCEIIILYIITLHIIVHNKENIKKKPAIIK